MDLPWGDERSVQFVTNVGLITSEGQYGSNIMACEWTHHISYSPGLIAVCIHARDATAENIKETKEFGVNICSTEQSVMSSVSGTNTGKSVDKIKVLEELGFKFYKAKKIKTLMVKDAVINVECKLFKEILLGDHIMFIGEVVEASLNKNKDPLVYHKGKYWNVGKIIEKPPEKELEKIRKLVENYRKD